MTLIDEKKLVLVNNMTPYFCTLENPPILIRYTLNVLNTTRTREVTDPATGTNKTVSES